MYVLSQAESSLEKVTFPKENLLQGGGLFFLQEYKDMYPLLYITSKQEIMV